MSDIFDQLISGVRQNAPQAELLEALGKKAAALYLNEKEPLNSSIVKLASEHPQLENEHIKRIAEFANNAVFQQMHNQSEDKNVHFPVADPGTIIQDLKDGGSPMHDGKTMNAGMQPKRSMVPSAQNADYQTAPRSIPSTEGFEDTTAGWNELDRRNQVSGVMGTGEPIAKQASAEYPTWSHSDPVEDVFRTHLKLRAVKEKLAEAHENFDLALKTAKEDFYQSVKHFVLDPDGPGLMSVVNAVKLASPNDSFAFQILRPVAERLVKEGAVRSDKLEKTASVQKMVNLNHPIVVSYLGILKMAEEKVRSHEALREAERAYVQTGEFLRKNVQ